MRKRIKKEWACGPYQCATESALKLERGIKAYVLRYNEDRPHQSLGDAAAEEIYRPKMKIAA